MSRQYFADTLVEPLGVSFGTVTATTETVLVPTAFTPIAALEPRAGKVYELLIGGTCTTGTSGTVIVSCRYGTALGCSQIAVSGTQAFVPSITNAPFILRCYLIFRSIGVAGLSSAVIANGGFNCGGAVATSASETTAWFNSAAAVNVDTSIASALWVGVTFSTAPSIIPFFHIWRSLN